MQLLDLINKICPIYGLINFSTVVIFLFQISPTMKYNFSKELLKPEDLESVLSAYYRELALEGTMELP